MPSKVDTPIPGRGSVYLSAKSWSIDPVAGIDAIGRGYGSTASESDAHPIKTLSFLDYLLTGNPGFSDTVIFRILNDVPTSDSRVMQNITTKDGGVTSYPMFVGIPGAPLATGVISGYTAAVPAANTGFLVDLPSAATHIGRVIIDQDNRYAFVLDAASANVAVISQPMVELLGSVATDGVPPEPRDLVNGKTYGVYTFPKMPFYPLGPGATFGAVIQLDILGGITSVNMCGSQPYIMKCVVRGASPAGNASGGAWSGGFAFWSGVLFTNSGANSMVCFSGSSHNIHAGTALNATIFAANGAGVSFQETLGLYNSQVRLDETSSAQGVKNTGPRLQVGVFNTTKPAFTGGRVRLPSDGGTVYGAGNTSNIFSVPQGSSYSVPKAGCTAATSGDALSVGGTPKTFADVPFINPTNNATITDGP